MAGLDDFGGLFPHLSNSMILDKKICFYIKGSIKSSTNLSLILYVGSKLHSTSFYFCHTDLVNTVDCSKLLRVWVLFVFFSIQKNAKSEPNFMPQTPCNLFNKEIPVVGLGTLEDSLFVTHTEVACFYKANQTSVSLLYHWRFPSSLVANIYTYVECYGKNNNVSHCS